MKIFHLKMFIVCPFHSASLSGRTTHLTLHVPLRLASVMCFERQQTKEACGNKESEELMDSITDITWRQILYRTIQIMGTKTFKEMNCNTKSFFSGSAIYCRTWLPIGSILLSCSLVTNRNEADIACGNCDGSARYVVSGKALKWNLRYTRMNTLYFK